MRVVLASQSPRRRELMETLGFDFLVDAADIDEETAEYQNPKSYVRETALRKARAVTPKHPGCVIVAADTIVVIDDRVLGKPHDEAEAETMLSLLSGRSHDVYTGIAIIYENKCRTFVEKTRVFVAPLASEEIKDYVSTGEPLDKAGAYGIQGAFGKFIRRIEGDYFNVVGLPVCRLYHEMKKIMAIMP